MSTGTGQVDNPAISAAFHAKMHQDTITVSEYVSVADRLTRRAHEKTFLVDIDEDLQVEIFTPTDGEYMELVRLQNDMLKLGKRIKTAGISDVDQATKAFDEVASGWDRIHELIARLCVDPSLDFEFFQKGMISPEDKQVIVQGIIDQVQGNREKTVSFREEQPRP